MAIMVIAEHDNTQLKTSTLNLVVAAQQFNQPITVWVIGHQCQAVAEQAAKINGIQQVIKIDHLAYENFLAENMAQLIVEYAEPYHYLLAAASTFGKNIVPRIAAMLNYAQISDVIAIIDANTFVRPIYAGNAIATVQALDPVKILTIRTSSFNAASFHSNAVTITTMEATESTKLSRFIGLEQTQSERPELAAAKIVVAGGRGLQSRENFKLLEQLADKLGAAIGSSRAAVDAGFVPNDYQVGQTGKVVAPQLYIAVGISGAIQHIAGMKESKVIVAINKDPDAPIFQIADYGLVGDLFEVIPSLIAELEQVV